MPRGLCIGAAILAAALAAGLSGTLPRARPSGSRLPDFFAAPAAAQPAPPAPGDVVVARVGSSVITARELEQRLAETPRATLAKLGGSPEEIRRAFLDQVLVRDALLAEEAKARGLDKRRDARERILGALRAALLDSVRREKASVTEDEIKAYYEANADKFSAPKRIGIHRILVDSKEEAEALIEEMGTVPDPKKWNEEARARSRDRSTHLRGGNLGFVSEDGSASKTDVKVDPALFKAAEQVKDGEIVPRPVAEGARFAVVWKRQSMSAVKRSLEAESSAIRAAVADAKVRDAVQEILKGLRPEHVTELNVELCDMVTVTAQGDVEKARRPGVLPRGKRGASPVPVETQGGLR
jgi:peptidyl-prolyl cis-trans isomerase C